MTGAPASRGASDGFTLIELLVATTLLGILMTALFGGLRLGARVWEASDRVVRDEGRAMSIRSFLRDRLEHAMPVAKFVADGESEVIFAGKRSTLRMASTMPESLGLGPYIIEILLVPSQQGANQSDLVLRWRMIWNDGAASEADAVGERMLLHDLSDVSFDYYGVKNGEGGGAAWHTTWQEQDHLPDLIRLDVHFHKGSKSQWSSLIVSPKVDEWYDTYY